MKRFTKRLLTGAVSGAMALSLMPATSFGGYEAKAAELEFDDRLYIEMMPGDFDDSLSWGFNGYDASKDEGYYFLPTSITVDPEYADYLTVFTEDYEGDGRADRFELNSGSEWGPDGPVVERADRQQDAIGKTIPITVAYVDRDDPSHTGTTTGYVKFVTDKYRWECQYSSGTNAFVPGQAQSAKISVWHEAVEWSDFDEGYHFTCKDIENPSYEWHGMDGDDRAEVTGLEDCGFITVREINDGEDYNYDWYDVAVDFSENGELKDTFHVGFNIFWDYWTIDFDYAEGSKEVENLLVGETATFTPKLMYYSVENPIGEAVADAIFDFGDDLNIINNGDGSYSFIRKSQMSYRMGVIAMYKGHEGEDRKVYRDFGCDELDASIGNIYTDDGLFVMYKDSDPITVKIDTESLDAICVNPADCYSIKWRVTRGNFEDQDHEVLGDDGSGYSATRTSDGIVIAPDGKSVTIDSQTIMSKYLITNSIEEEGDGYNVIFLKAEFFDMNGESFDQRDDRIEIQRSEVNDSEFSHSWDEWVRDEYLFPGDVFYLDTFYYYVQNADYPKATYVPYNIQVTSIEGFAWPDQEGELFGPAVNGRTVELKTINGRPALTTIGEDCGIINKVNFTYKDASGNDKEGFFTAAITDEALKLTLENIDRVDDEVFDTIRADSYLNCLNFNFDLFTGHTVTADVKAILRTYDYETQKVVSEDVTDKLDELYVERFDDNDKIQVALEGNKMTISGTSDGWESTGFNVNASYGYKRPYIDEQGNSRSEMRNANSSMSIGVNVMNNTEAYVGLDLDSIDANGGSITWDPLYIGHWFDYETNKEASEDRTEGNAFGFTYDSNEISVTVDGKELGSGNFSDGPFVITKKIDKPIKMVVIRAEKRDEDSISYYGWANEKQTSGSSYESVHSVHSWSEKVIKRATIGESGSIAKICAVGGETVTEEIPAIKSVTLNKTTLAYTGAKQTVKVIVKDAKGNVIPDTEYYATNLTKTNAGTYKVVVTFSSEKYEGFKTLTYKIVKPELKYRAYVQKKNWMTWQTAAISSTPSTKTMAGTTDNLRMETIQMQLSGVGGEIRYRAYCQKKGWVGVGTATGGWATTANKNTNAGTKGESRRVEMIQLQTKGEVSTLYDIYYQAYSEKFGWLAWAGNNEKAGSAGYAYKLEAFRVQLVPKGAKFDKTKGASKKKSFYDKTKDGANPK